MDTRHFAAILFMSTLAAAAPGVAQGPTASQIAHGKYLVEEVAKCGDCHTPRTETGQLDQAHWLQGAMLDFQPTAPVPGWVSRSPNIAGLPGWKDADAIKFFETGLTRSGKPANPPMPDFHLKHEDAVDVVMYLKSLKASK